MNFVTDNSTHKRGVDESSRDAIESAQGFPELEFFDRVESSFAAIASQHKLPHRRLLALGWAAKFHGISVGLFRQAFELWLEAVEGGEG